MTDIPKLFPPKSMSRQMVTRPSKERSKQELKLQHELEMLKLQLDHSFAMAALGKGGTSAIAAIVAVTGSLMASMFVAGPHSKSGTDFVMVVGILAATFLVYFAFVFGRQLRIKAKIAEKQKELDVTAGDSVR